MSRRCQCRPNHKCLHWTRGGTETLPTDRILAVEPVLRTLIDAADQFDQAGLQINAECEIHGSNPMPNADCICIGTRYSALEFIECLQLELRSAGGTYEYPAGSPNRRREGILRLAAG